MWPRRRHPSPPASHSTLSHISEGAPGVRTSMDAVHLYIQTAHMHDMPYACIYVYVCDHACMFMFDVSSICFNMQGQKVCALLPLSRKTLVCHVYLTCKRGSVGQSEGLLIPRSSVWFRLKPENSNSNECELHRPSIKGTKLLLKVTKTIIIIIYHSYGHQSAVSPS